MQKMIWCSILIPFLFFHGCAYKKYIKSGDDLLSAGKVEQAIERYEESLMLNRNSTEASERLEHARSLLEDWRGNVLLKEAATAEEKGLDGLSLLLYAKANTIKKDIVSDRKVKELKEKITPQIKYKVSLSIHRSTNKALNHGLKTAFENLNAYLAEDQALIELTGNAPNRFELTLESPSFSETIRTESRSGTYVSQTIQVDNPEYFEALDEINHTKSIIADLKRERNEYKRDMIYYAKRCHDDSDISSDFDSTSFEKGDIYKDISAHRPHIADKKTPFEHYNHENSSAEQYRYETPSSERYSHEKTNCPDREKFERVKWEHGKIIRDILEAYESLERLEENLRQIPATIPKDVYSTHHYPVTIHELKSTLNFALKNSGGNTHKNITLTYSDDEHDAQPLLNIPGNPLRLPDSNEMTSRLILKARGEVVRAIKADFERKRKQFIKPAALDSDHDRLVNDLVYHCLSCLGKIDILVSCKIAELMEKKLGRICVIDASALAE